MTPDDHVAEMESLTVEVMRVARTALEIVMRNPRDDEDAAKRLVALLQSLSQMEAHCLIVVLCAQMKTCIDVACRVMVDWVSAQTNEPPPDWIVPAMNAALAEHIRKGIDPDRPGVRQTMHDIFMRNIKEEGNE